MPRSKNHARTFVAKLYSIKVLRKVAVILYWLLGHLEATPEDYGSYHDFKSFLFQHLKQESYDALMVIYSPSHHLKLGAELSKRFGIPLWFDLRDIWPGNRIARIDYRPNFLERTQDMFYSYYWRKWFRQCEGFSITSKPWADILSERIHKPGFVVTNGYEKNLFRGITDYDSRVFTVAHVGTLYDEQPITIFFEGISMFINQKLEADFQVSFVGVNDTMRRRIEKVASSFGVGKYITCYPRLSRDNALGAMRQAQILFYPPWPTVSGTYSGKIFEYLASGTCVLIAPGDKGVVDDLLRETQGGVICDTPAEVLQVLNERYDRWELGEGKWRNDATKVAFYSRENQAMRLAQLLGQCLKSPLNEQHDKKEFRNLN